MTKRDELIALDPAGLEAAVRECARITAPEISDVEYERIKADNSPRYQNTRAEMERALRAYLNAARSDAPGGVGVKEALKTAIAHIEHMAAFITRANEDYHCGTYSFESLGEDMPGMREALDAEERYLLDHFGSEADIMPGDVSGVFHRLRAALTAPGATTVPTLVDDPNSASGKRVEYQRPSDPSSTRSEVTVELRSGVLSAIRSIYGIGFGTFAGGYQNDSIERAADKIVALLDQFEIRRK